MTTATKAILAAAALLLVAFGSEGLYLHHRNMLDAQDKPIVKPTFKADPDDDVFLHHEHPMSLADQKSLKGRTLWVSAGGQMEFYPVTGHTVDYTHPVGYLLGAEKITVQDAIEQAAPKKAAFRIPQGDKQILLVFTKPAGNKLYAVPVGFVQGTDTNLSTDEIFFYDDPHKLFAYWGPQVWQAIDEHRAIPGMTEREAQMALGQVSDPKGDTTGDRTVIYDDGGHPKSITFRDNKAITITDQKE